MHNLPKSPPMPNSESASSALSAVKAEKKSGAPLPKARKVTPLAMSRYHNIKFILDSPLSFISKKMSF